MCRFLFESIYFEITAFCNRNCPYCYNDSNSTGNYLDKNIIYKILHECRRNEVKSITISGGEPFCHPNIKDIICEMSKLNITGTIISNLSLLTDEQIENLLLSGHNIQATLDSCNPEENDITRGNGSYDAVMNLISIAQKCKCLNRIILRFNLSKKNTFEIEEIVTLALRNKLPLLNIALLTKAGRAITYDGVYDYNTDLTDIAHLMKRLQEIQDKYKEKIIVDFSDIKNQVGCILYSDGEIRLSPKINSDGNVFFCQLFSGDENSLGNVYNDSLTNILKSEQAMHVANYIRQRKKKQTSCVNCEFTDFCMCGCPAVSYNQTGNVYDTGDQCSMIKYFIKEKIKQMCDKDEYKRNGRTV